MSTSYKSKLTQVQMDNWKVKEKEILDQEINNLSFSVQKMVSNNVIPIISLYLSLKAEGMDTKKATIIAQSYLIDIKIDKRNILSKIAKNYGGFLLFRKIVKKNYKNDGFGYKLETEDGKHLSFTVNQCIIKNLCQKYECLELLTVFCDSNWTEFCEIPSIEFSRSKTMGNGDEICDFNFLRTKKTGN